jgi:hypothetical protein
MTGGEEGTASRAKSGLPWPVEFSSQFSNPHPILSIGGRS